MFILTPKDREFGTCRSIVKHTDNFKIYSVQNSS